MTMVEYNPSLSGKLKGSLMLQFLDCIVNVKNDKLLDMVTNDIVYKFIGADSFEGKDELKTFLAVREKSENTQLYIKGALCSETEGCCWGKVKAWDEHDWVFSNIFTFRKTSEGNKVSSFTSFRIMASEL
ncbi:MAG: hypothetical protein VB108_08745 [Anaerolineaceae bacterium]|nr:hypothetical protein [Anaerolineaceae bacterium]